MARSRDAGARDHFEDVLQMAMCLAVTSEHAEFGGRDAAALRLFDFEFRARSQPFESVHQRLAVGARVDQRAHRHISADAGERV